MFKKKRISDFSPSITKDDLKKRVKILVVDDNEEHFPYKRLQDSGYTIEWWNEVTSEKLQRMENGAFDIIILDIKGIADATISDSEGLGIIKRIKSVNPSQIVVAFSGHSFDLSKTEFWKISDDTLTKPVSIIKAKELIDRLIDEKITLNYYWDAISLILSNQGLSRKQIRKIENTTVSMLENNSLNPDLIISKFLTGVQNTSAIITLIQAIGRLWT